MPQMLLNGKFFPLSMIKNFEPRLYQQTIFGTCSLHNTLVVLPTGLGKTNVFLMVVAQRLKQYPHSKIMLLGPTRPLIDQYLLTFKKHLQIEEKDMSVITGMISPEKRKEIYKTSKIIFSTPQAVENDIISNRIELSEYSLLGIDEAHRATGDYAYNFISKQYQKHAKYPRIIALTASPGSDLEKINEVITNLNIEAVEVRTELDPDVKPYIQEVELTWIEVELPQELLETKKLLDGAMKNKLKELKEYDLITDKQIIQISKTDILKLQGFLQGKLASGEKSIEILKGLSLLAECIKIEHAMELLESQGISSLNDYLQNILKESYTTKTKATQNLARDLYFRSATAKVNLLYDRGVEHPKVERLKNFIKKKIDLDKKAIVFTQFRDTGKRLVEELNKLEGISSNLFVGQMKKNNTGLSQKQQKEMLDEFRENKFNILVATSVGEEGLDIPRVDFVLFYEPIPSAIRTIQRRGRTGRMEKGSVVVFMTKNTRDVGYKWSAHHKEQRMHKILKELKNRFESSKNTKTETLQNYIKDEEEVEIYADSRERANGCIKELIELGIKIKLSKLDVGDFMLSSRVVLEFKKIADFVDSIVDGRLMSQLKNLKKYEKPLLIVEGTHDIYSQRNLHPNAIRGMISTITIDYGIPIIYTKNPLETAAYMAVIAKREQIEKKNKAFSLHPSKPQSFKQAQEYIIGSLPGVGPTLSKPLLEKFKSVKNIINAPLDQLKQIDLIGETKARKIRDILDRDYDDN